MRTGSKILTLGMLILILGSCASTPKPLPCPPRPSLEPISADLQRQTPIEVLEVMTENQIRLKAYSKKLEVRARCGK